MASSAPDLAILPVTSERMDQLAALFRTGEPGGCWDMEPRLTPAQDRACIRRWQIEDTRARSAAGGCSVRCWSDHTRLGCWPATASNRWGGSRSDRAATTSGWSSHERCRPWTTCRCG
jgi:hypothetical protein